MVKVAGTTLLKSVLPVQDSSVVIQTEITAAIYPVGYQGDVFGTRTPFALAQTCVPYPLMDTSVALLQIKQFICPY